MSESPGAETSAPSPSVPPSGAASGSFAEALAREPLSVRELLEAGVHFGHQTQRWNPRMREFIFGERDGIHIVNLDQTLARLEEALDFLRETTAGGGKVLFVGTKRQAAPSVESEARRASQFYVSSRWLGGMLTNFRTVKKSIEHYKTMLATLDDQEKLAELSKKDRSRISREVNKYRRSLEGIKEMTKLPDALFVIDVSCEHIAIAEARRLGIPIVAVVDTNCDPIGIDFVVPGNDDAVRAIQLYCARVADACLAGAELFNERVQAQASREAETRVERAAAPTTGRVVVEIKQPPRRGRGAEERARGRRGGRPHAEETHAEPEAPEAGAAPAAPAPAAPAETAQE
jgi:small subunit ribosomal protein S2